MDVKARSMGLIVAAAFVVGIGASMLAGYWATESTKVPVKFSTGEFAGEYNPADIRGSYAFADIEEIFGIDSTTLAEAFGVTDREDPGAFQAKELEEIYGETTDGGEVGTDALRLFVARYLGLPYTPEESTRLPNPSLAILKERLAPADYEALAGIGVGLSEVRLAEQAEHQETEDRAVRGNTTFNDLLTWGVSREQIEEVLGLPMGATSQTVREYLLAKDIEFSMVKDKLQALVDAAGGE